MSKNQALLRLRSLPVMPRIAQEILVLKIETEEGEKALLELVRNDPAISAKVIGLANSPAFGTMQKILSVSDAAARLGIKRVKLTAMILAMMTSMVRTPGGLLNANSLWKHSLAVTMTMHSLAQYMPEAIRPMEDDLFLAGLLHDIGFLVLDSIDPMLSDSFHARLEAENGRSEEEIESAMLEMDHCELGAELAKHWGLPEAIVNVLRHHHRPEAASPPLTRMACLAEKLLPTFGDPEKPLPISAEEWRAVGMDPEKQEEISAIAKRHAREVSASFD
jgi:putative nucleotidyltransferase with HDIG domain